MEPTHSQSGLAADASPFLVQIGQLYEGPFDLLLDLIRRQNINIYDIPIAAITTEYLTYVETLRDLDVEVAAEFLVVAATLIQIKSKMMLPADPVLPGEEPAPDPREELVQRLLEYEQFKQAAAQLHERQQLEEASWSCPQRWDHPPDEDPAQLSVGLHDLVTTFREVLERLRERPQLMLAPEEVSVRSMIEHIHHLLMLTEEPVPLRPLLQQALGKPALLASFLAILELVRLQVAMLRQDRPFGDILLKRHRRFHQAWLEFVALSPGESE
ncbi:MAG: segregation and condensation protein A [Terriglobales bacterium]